MALTNDGGLAAWRDALDRPAGDVRLEFGIAFGLQGGGTYQTITASVRNERGRWVKVSPFLVCDENTRAGLLETVAKLIPEDA